jgi:hypothetical protein
MWEIHHLFIITLATKQFSFLKHVLELFYFNKIMNMEILLNSKNLVVFFK